MSRNLVNVGPQNTRVHPRSPQSSRKDPTFSPFICFILNKEGSSETSIKLSVILLSHHGFTKLAKH